VHGLSLKVIRSISLFFPIAQYYEKVVTREEILYGQETTRTDARAH
jgi:hypothetical protein